MRRVQSLQRTTSESIAEGEHARRAGKAGEIHDRSGKTIAGFGLFSAGGLGSILLLVLAWGEPAGVLGAKPEEKSNAEERLTLKPVEAEEPTETVVSMPARSEDLEFDFLEGDTDFSEVSFVEDGEGFGATEGFGDVAVAGETEFLSPEGFCGCTNDPPVIGCFDNAEGYCNVWLFDGFVSDENPGSVSIDFGGLLEGHSTSACNDGSFSYEAYLGCDAEGAVSAIATDELGQVSEEVFTYVYKCF